MKVPRRSESSYSGLSKNQVFGKAPSIVRFTKGTMRARRRRAVCRWWDRDAAKNEQQRLEPRLAYIWIHALWWAWGCAGVRRDIAKRGKIRRLNHSGAPWSRLSTYRGLARLGLSSNFLLCYCSGVFHYGGNFNSSSTIPQTLCT